MSAPAVSRAESVIAPIDDVRPLGTCPVCGASTRTLDRFAFGPKRHLPDTIAYDVCDACDYLFAADVSESSYAAYYAAVQNDSGHVVAIDGAESEHIRLQCALLEGLLPPSFDGSVLDFGCGEGHLLQALATRFPGASLYGHDVADYLPVGSTVRFIERLEERRYDIIVVSHVLEHLVRFSILEVLRSLLAAGGMLYVEVPDPSGYLECPRREFMYYVDRLHINHFSESSIRRLLERSGFEVSAAGRHRFAYRDGRYPAAWFVASSMRRAARPSTAPSLSASLEATYRRYRAAETDRASAFRERLRAVAGDQAVLVYGAGDNFRRARWDGGPLNGIPILAVMDRHASEMAAERGLAFEVPPVALRRHPGAAVVVTPSQGSDAIAASIRHDWPARPIFFV